MADAERGLVADEPGGNLALDLFVLAQHVGALIDEALEGTGLSASQYAVYSKLARGARTPTELAVSLGLPPATLSGYLAQMERAGHIVRTRSASDGRSWLITLTDAGEDRVLEGRPRFRQSVRRLNRAVGDTDDVRRAREQLGVLDRAIAAARSPARS